jgi:pantoate kinase
MSKINKRVILEVPHRISGFFEIVDSINGIKINDPVKIGSRGAGFCVNVVGKTEIIIQKSDNLDLEIIINGKKLDQKAETTYFIAEYIKKYIKKSWKIKINHIFDLPVGCGYGASGSGALGTIFGLDYLLNLNLPFEEKARIAHISEVVNRTGLGTVCGQLGGGIGIIKEPGFPCSYERFEIPRNLRIICGSFGMIHTKSILNDPILSLKIKEEGKNALNKLIQKPNIKTFIKESIKFVKNIEILEILELHRVKELMESLNRLDIIGASMNQLGRSVYAVCKKENERDVFDIFDSFNPGIKITSTSIHEKKSIILKKA